jgi:hypothetical protein
MRVQWDFALTLPALGIHGVTAQPALVLQGTHADIYEHSADPGKLIKITDDPDDGANTVTAQSLNSPNVVRCHAHTTAGVVNGTALLVDWVKGKRASYSTPEFLTKQELYKLSQLFRTIDLLETRLSIYLVDLADNVIDAGHAYVVVDFGR